MTANSKFSAPCSRPLHVVEQVAADRGDAYGAWLICGHWVDKYDRPPFPELGHAVADVELVRSVLDLEILGDPLTDPGESQVRERLTDLAAALPDGGVLIALWSGHAKTAANGALRVYAKDSPPTNLGGFSAADVASACAGSGANQLLLIFDTCFSGAGLPVAGEVAAAVLAETPPEGERVWVGLLTSCRRAETAVDGVFGPRLAALLREGPSDADLRRRWSVHNRHVRGDDLCDALVKGWGDDRQQPDYQGRGDAWWMFPNPCFDPGAPGQVVEHLLLAARGGALLDEPSWFSGRVAEVNQVVSWVSSSQPGIRVVTGSAGTGKSAIAGRVVSLANPRERQRLLHESAAVHHADPGEGSVTAHVHARALSADQVAEELDGGLVAVGWMSADETGRRNAAELVGRVQRTVETGGRPPVLVVDGLDEARREAFPIARDVLTRLARHAILVVATRNPPDPTDPDTTLVDVLRPVEVLDLDGPACRAAGAAARREYVSRRLAGVAEQMDPAAVADLLAETTPGAADRPFLLARLVTDQLRAAPVDTSLPGWPQQVARSVEAAFDVDLARISRPGMTDQDASALGRRLLTVLTWALGAGLPEDEWRTIATEFGGHPVGRDEISWLLDRLGRYA